MQLRSPVGSREAVPTPGMPWISMDAMDSSTLPRLEFWPSAPYASLPIFPILVNENTILPVAKTINLKFILNSFLMSKWPPCQSSTTVGFLSYCYLSSNLYYCWHFYPSCLQPYHSFIYPSIYNTTMECFLAPRHCAGNVVQEVSITSWSLFSCRLYEGPSGHLKLGYDHAISCSASFSRLSSFRAVSAFLRVVWNGLCETLLTAFPGEPWLQLDTGPPGNARHYLPVAHATRVVATWLNPG